MGRSVSSTAMSSEELSKGGTVLHRKDAPVKFGIPFLEGKVSLTKLKDDH